MRALKYHISYLYRYFRENEIFKPFDALLSRSVKHFEDKKCTWKITEISFL